MTFFISYFISIPLGYYKALKHGSVFDSASSILIFEVGLRLAGGVENAAVVGVHEDVGAALQLVVDARRAFELVGAGAGAADELKPAP